MLGMSLPGAGRGEEKKKHLNIEMGGRGVGAWGGGRIAYEMECLDARLLKIGFPIFSPGYGPQNVPASILYSTVGHRGSYKH